MKTFGRWLLNLAVMFLSIGAVVYLFVYYYQKGELHGTYALQYPKTEAQAEGTAPQMVDVEALKTPTPELIAKGAQLYQVNCASCHGETGEGNGPAGLRLNPRPRNFKVDPFKYGTSIAGLHGVLTNGIPGTSMPAFNWLSEEERYALVHYLRAEMIPNPEPESGSTPAAASGSGGASAPAPPVEEKPTERIPISLALQRLAEPVPSARPHAVDASRYAMGAVLYAQLCASCHGAQGEGGVALGRFGADPQQRLLTTPIAVPGAPWLVDRAYFDRVLTQGLQGRLMPGYGTLRRAELDALYAYLKALATGE
ncbi:MAG: c-type cytochrome [Bacteroidetes bacterium]|nr:c-type cytochrome [Rhodothermia bacterium]MCS7154923.1 c-type cytochrome [Bacteroidota bacterium]MCX7906918.1 c-type cytochrome [Bacteroidota bacterium]MDW8137718.1 c-type cytochrome [Bacteroidota bacterium]MDW8285328.1 c-type cytochrome [Bacteroidota bacterium]